MPLELLTFSKRRNFQDCHRYFHLKHNEHLAPRFQRRGRRRGSAFGDALLAVREHMTTLLEQYHDNPTDLPHRNMWLRDVVAASVDSFYAEVHPQNQEDEDEIRSERIKVLVMAVCYIEHYGIDHRRELEFDLHLINPKTNRSSRAFRRAGKIDGVVVTGPQQVQLIEDKFVAQIQRMRIAALPLDAQSMEYVDAFAQKGWKATVAYRHTKVPGMNLLPPKEFKTKDDYPGETFDEFEDRVFEDVRSREPNQWGNTYYFDQQILDFPLDQITEHSTERWSIAQDILTRRRMLRRGEGLSTAFPRNRDWCLEYGGCEFIPLCSGQEDAAALYVTEDENPELSERNESVGPTAAG